QGTRTSSRPSRRATSATRAPSRASSATSTTASSAPAAAATAAPRSRSTSTAITRAPSAANAATHAAPIPDAPPVTIATRPAKRPAIASCLASPPRVGKEALARPHLAGYLDRMPFLTHEGISLRYDRAGSGPAVLLVHGWCSNRTFWERQVVALRDRHT